MTMYRAVKMLLRLVIFSLISLPSPAPSFTLTMTLSSTISSMMATLSSRSGMFLLCLSYLSTEERVLELVSRPVVRSSASYSYKFTGWSTNIPSYNPEDIVSNLRRLMKGGECVPMTPWFRNWRVCVDHLLSVAPFIDFNPC